MRHLLGPTKRSHSGEIVSRRGRARSSYRVSRKIIILLILASFVWALPGPTLARPAEVVLLRHAEKPDDPAALHLSERGRQRAAALPDWFATNSVVTLESGEVLLIATQITHHDRGQRPYETLAPLAQKLQLTIQTSFPASDHKALARWVMTSPECDGKTIVICWVHESLPDLATDFGVKSVPTPWKAHVFDRAWVIRWPKQKAKLLDLPQRILPGDSPR
jgi:hypothetical protein